MRLLTLLAAGLTVMGCNNSAKMKDIPSAGGAGIKDTVQTAKQMPEMQHIPDTIFTASGNEPFWSVYVIRHSKIVFHPADGRVVEAPYVETTTPASNVV